MILGACYLLVLGFILAWLTGVVSSEEISVKQGFLVMTGAVMIGIAFYVLLVRVLGELTGWLTPAVGACSITLLLKAAERQISWKHCGIIGAIYAVMFFGAVWMMS